MHRIGCLVIAAAAMLVLPASAAELVMFRRAGCPWCEAWDREVGGIYAKTEIGRRVPLRQVDLDGPRPDLVLNSAVRYSPTFVLVRDGRELSRIEGYPGESFFWGLLERAIERVSRPETTGFSDAMAPMSAEKPHAPTGPSQTTQP
jgi:hypothetical protein